MFIFLKFLPPRYIKINFDDGVKGNIGGASFVIRGTGLGLMAAGRSHLYEPMVPVTELQDAWTGISYSQRVLRADHHIVEVDSTTVVIWIQERIWGEAVRHLIYDIAIILRELYLYKYLVCLLIDKFCY